MKWALIIFLMADSDPLLQFVEYDDRASCLRAEAELADVFTALWPDEEQTYVGLRCVEKR